MNIDLLRAELVDTSRLFGPRRRKRAAERLASLSTPDAAAVLAEALVLSTDRQVVDIARRSLETSQDQAVIDAVAGVVLSTGDERLAALVANAATTPSDPGRRAVVLFLTGDFVRYEQLDFDGSLLRAARTVAGPALRMKLAEKARVAGRLDWARTVVGSRDAEQVPLSRPEWDAAVEVLSDAGQWDELLRLAPRVPVSWVAPVLRDAGRARWRPSNDTDRVAFNELVRLATNASAREVPTASEFGDENLTLIPAGVRVESLTVTRDGKLLISGGHRTPVRTWRIPSATPAGLFADGPQHVLVMATTPNGEVLATGDLRGKIRLWELPSGAPAGELVGHKSNVLALAMTPDGKLLASGGYGNKVRLWDFGSRTTTAALNADWVWTPCLAVTPDGKLLAGGGQKDVRLWRLPSGTLIRTLSGHTDHVSAFAVTPDGGLLASGSYDNTIRLWHLPSGVPAGILRGHTAGVLALALTPDGHLLASAGKDLVVRLWHLPSGEPAGELYGHTAQIECLVMSPDGLLLASGSRSGSILWWTRKQSRLGAIAVTPLAQVTTAQVDDLRQSSREFSADERAWFELVEALLRWRGRNDVELVDAAATAEAAAWDIELDEAPDRQKIAHKPRQHRPKRKGKRKRGR